MAKIVRKTQQIFGSNAAAAAGGIGQFGSLAAGSVAYSKDPAVIQGLSNYLSGWGGAVVGNNSPAIEDVNALEFLTSYQLAYLMQEGVAEWDAGTTYYSGSIVSDGTGNLLRSLSNTNINNPLTDGANWSLILGAFPSTVTANKTLANSDPIDVYLLPTSADITVALPTTVRKGRRFRFIVPPSGSIKQSTITSGGVNLAIIGGTTSPIVASYGCLEIAAITDAPSTATNWQITSVNETIQFSGNFTLTGAGGASVTGFGFIVKTNNQVSLWFNGGVQVSQTGGGLLKSTFVVPSRFLPNANSGTTIIPAPVISGSSSVPSWGSVSFSGANMSIGSDMANSIFANASGTCGIASVNATLNYYCSNYF